MAAGPAWGSVLSGTGGDFVYLELPVYYDLLAPFSEKVEVWETTYYHTLASNQALIEWYRGTGLRPFLERLPDEAARTRFEQDVLEGCREEYPRQARRSALCIPSAACSAWRGKHSALRCRPGDGAPTGRPCEKRSFAPRGIIG